MYNMSQREYYIQTTAQAATIQRFAKGGAVCMQEGYNLADRQIVGSFLADNTIIYTKVCDSYAVLHLRGKHVPFYFREGVES
mgnify:CR=1 FL=1